MPSLRTLLTASLGLALLLPQAGRAHDADERPGAKQGAAVAQPTLAPFPALAARYRILRGVPDQAIREADWYFSRAADRIETAQAGYMEVWQRDVRGELSWQRVYPNDRKLIEFTPGELRTQRRTKDWSRLNTLVDTAQLASLRREGGGVFLGRPATHYSGEMGGERIEILWLDQEKLPARLSRVGRNGSQLLELQDLRTIADPAWPMIGADKIADYTHIDGADLGDMEYDPFVQKVLGTEHAGHQHAH